MNYRFMRVIVFFDLPTETLENKREYRRFRKALIKSGFIMMQESVYTKLVLNSTAARAVESNVEKVKPTAGLVQMITITEKQYSNMQIIVGEAKSDTISSDERFVEL